MQATYQIGERLGAPKHGFIPEGKRRDKPNRKRGETAEELYQYIKEHDGELITTKQLQAAGVIPGNVIMPYFKQLVKAGRITVVREGRSSRAYIGKRTDAPGARTNGPVIEKQPPAPVPRGKLDTLKTSAWAHLRARTKAVPPEQLGYEVIAIDAFLETLESKLEYSPSTTEPSNGLKDNEVKHED